MTRLDESVPCDTFSFELLLDFETYSEGPKCGTLSDSPFSSKKVDIDDILLAAWIPLPGRSDVYVYARSVRLTPGSNVSMEL